MNGPITWQEYVAVSSTEYTGVNEIIKPGVVKKLYGALERLNGITSSHSIDYLILPLRITRVADENLKKEHPTTNVSNSSNNLLLKDVNQTSDFPYFSMSSLSKEECNSSRKSKELNIVDDFKDVICFFYSKKNYPRGINWELLFNKLCEIIMNDYVKVTANESLHFVSFVIEVFQVLMDNRYIKVTGITIGSMFQIHNKMAKMDYGIKDYSDLFPQSIIDYMFDISDDFIAEFDKAKEQNLRMQPF